jgi:sporulation protein YlmC with PRC-barrel domain
MSKLKLLSSAAVAALLAMPAYAQTTSPTTSPSANRPATSAPSGSAARQTLPSDIKAWKVSDLVGKNVYNSQDEKVGDINDIVKPKSGGEAMAVIGVGGFLGIGEKEAAVPIDQLKVQGDKIVGSGLSKDSLKQHADYKKDNYEKVDREQVVGQLSGTSGTSGSGATGSSSTTGGGTGATGTPPSTSGSSGSSGMSGSSTTGGSTGSTSGMSGSGASSGGSGSMGSGSTSGSGSSTGTGSANPGATSNPPANTQPQQKQ